MTFRKKGSDKSKVAGCLIAMAIYHICGALWYMILYSGKDTDIPTLLMTCTVPFILPDIIKLIFAYTVYVRLKKAKII